MAIFERQLLLEGPIFDFHDCGRKCNPPIFPCPFYIPLGCQGYGKTTFLSGSYIREYLWDVRF